MRLAEYENRLAAIAARRPGMPMQAVLLVRMVRLLERLLEERLDAVLAEAGLNASSWTVLTMLYCDPQRAIPPSCLSTAVAQSRAHMTRLADELVGGGWVERVPSKTDRRSVDLHLTPDGEARVERLLPKVGACYREVVGVFSETDAAQLEVLLRRWIMELEVHPTPRAGAPMSRE